MLDLSLLANRLQCLIDATGVSRVTLAHDSGVSAAQIWKLLNRHRPQVQADTLAKLADALDTTMDYLAGRTDDPLPHRRRRGAGGRARLVRHGRARLPSAAGGGEGTEAGPPGRMVL